MAHKHAMVKLLSRCASESVSCAARSMLCFFFFSSRRRHTRCSRDWSSDVCSSDLKSFTEADRDRFLDDAFEFMVRFFENSLAELEKRNSGIETDFKRIDAHQFTAEIGRASCRERV